MFNDDFIPNPDPSVRVFTTYACNLDGGDYSIREGLLLGWTPSTTPGYERLVPLIHDRSHLTPYAWSFPVNEDGQADVFAPIEGFDGEEFTLYSIREYADLASLYPVALGRARTLSKRWGLGLGADPMFPLERYNGTTVLLTSGGLR